MTNEIGVWQHALGGLPNVAFGFCTDDVARALIVDVLHARQLGWAPLAESAARSVRFLEDAFVPEGRLFRNFRDAAGDWLDSGGSEDCQARALCGLLPIARSRRSVCTSCWRWPGWVRAAIWKSLSPAAASRSMARWRRSALGLLLTT